MMFVKVEETLKQDASTKWSYFKVYGVSIPEYILYRWEEHNAQKEMEKLEKVSLRRTYLVCRVILLYSCDRYCIKTR